MQTLDDAFFINICSADGQRLAHDNANVVIIDASSQSKFAHARGNASPTRHVDPGCSRTGSTTANRRTDRTYGLIDGRFNRHSKARQWTDGLIVARRIRARIDSRIEGSTNGRNGRTERLLDRRTDRREGRGRSEYRRNGRTVVRATQCLSASMHRRAVSRSASDETHVISDCVQSGRSLCSRRVR